MLCQHLACRAQVLKERTRVLGFRVYGQISTPCRYLARRAQVLKERTRVLGFRV